MIPLVLASASPRRRALIEALGVSVRVHPSDADEHAQGTPAEVVVRNARAKRDTVVDHLREAALVVAADTLVVLGDDILGKPRHLAEARGMLARLSGKTHRVYTGLSLIETAGGTSAEGVEVTEVTFRALSEEEIERFVEIVRPLDRAGGYTVDGPGSLLVERYNGCYQNVLGLPVVRLNALLVELGDGLARRMEPEKARFL